MTNLNFRCYLLKQIPGILSLGAAITVPVFGQAMIGHSVAMAGGSVAGTIAGKKVSDGLDSILGRVVEQTGQAAKTGKLGGVMSVKPAIALEKSYKAPKLPMPSESQPVGERTTVARRTRRQVSADRPNPVLERAIPQRTETAYALSRWQPDGQIADPVTVEKLIAVKPGASTEDLANLGVPASRIMMPGNDGTLLQRVKYKNAGRDVGIIYLADGKVVSVETVAVNN